MKQINLKEMYNAGVHLGSSVKKINPKMKPYIMCTHDGIAIIDILKTYTRLFRITLFLKKVISTEGYWVLFVGTQKSIAPLIAEIATKSSSYYINERWKGGFLTNFRTMKGNTVSNSPKTNNLKNETSWFSSVIDNKQLEPLTTNSENLSNPESVLSRVPFSANSRETMGRAQKNNGKVESNPYIKKNEKNNTQLFESNSLNSLPDLVIIVGQEKELKAIKECQKLNIPTITILDSDGDPEKTSLFIPANDDSRSSVEFILKHLGQSILVGRLLYDKKNTRVTPLSK